MTKKGFEVIRRAADAATARVWRDHLASHAAETPIVVFLDLFELGALDLWIADQPDPKPNREEAMRQLTSEAVLRRC